MISQRFIFILANDFNGFFIGKIRKYRLLVLSFFYTFYCYFKAYLYKIKIGSKCKFYGITILNRSFNSNIIIGNKCTFRSDKISNLVGLNRNCIIATFGEGSKVKIGNNSGFSGTVIGAACLIEIGDNVLSGANVLITDFDWHPIEPTKRHTNENVKSAPVKIGNNVWLGINSVILKGVTIGENTIIGANSLVVNDIPANVIAVGNPCKVIKNIM